MIYVNVETYSCVWIRVYLLSKFSVKLWCMGRFYFSYLVIILSFPGYWSWKWDSMLVYLNDRDPVFYFLKCISNDLYKKCQIFMLHFLVQCRHTCNWLETLKEHEIQCKKLFLIFWQIIFLILYICMLSFFFQLYFTLYMVLYALQFSPLVSCVLYWLKSKPQVGW